MSGISLLLSAARRDRAIAFLCSVLLMIGNPALAERGFEETNAGLEELSGGDIAVGDFNWDDWPDLAIAGWKWKSDKTGMEGPFTKVYRNNQDRTFTEVEGPFEGIGATDQSHGQLLWLDCNTDGYDDLLITGFGKDSQGAVLKLYRYDNVNVTFVDTGFSPTIKNGRLGAGDLDGLHGADIVVSGETTRVFVNQGNCVYQELDAGLRPNLGNFIIWDYDSDTVAEIIGSGVVDDGLKVLIYERTTSSPLSYAAQQYPLADMSNAEVFFSHQSVIPPAVAVIGQTAGAAQTVRVYSFNPTSREYVKLNADLPVVLSGQAVWGRFYSGANDDLALCGRTSDDQWNDPGVAKVFRNSGGIFTYENLAFPSLVACRMALGDFDRDYIDDLALSGSLSGFGFADVLNNYAKPVLRGIVWQEQGSAGLLGTQLNLVDRNGVTRTAMTDSTGWYQFSNVEIGEYSLYPTKARHNFTPASRAVTVTENFDSFQNFTWVPAVPTPDADGPDIRVSGVFAPQAVRIGNLLEITYDITVSGNVPPAGLEPFSVGIYLSENRNIVRGSDTLLAKKRLRGGLRRGQRFIAYIRVSKRGLNRGKYYVGVIADFSNEIAEKNEANNTRSSARRVTVRK